MRIVFWQNCLSPHQLPYIVHLMEDSRIDEVVVVAGKTVSETRKKMGWEILMLEGLDKCKLYINPHNTIINSILEKRLDESYHLFSGIRADAFVFKCLCLSMKFDLHRGIITERPNTYNFKLDITNGKPYWMHRLRFYIQDKKYAKRIKYVFAIGKGADTYFNTLGLDWKIHPFCYCTQFVPGNFNVASSLPQYTFVGSLTYRKNPISIVKAYSQVKCGYVNFLGDGVLKYKLQKEVERNHLQDNIKLLGTIPQQKISSYLYESDVLILPSFHDGWGAVVNEGLQTGCFVICSDACGACVLLENNKNLGLVFRAGNDRSLANCMKYVTTHIDEIRANRDNRVKWAETHIGGRVIAKYLIDCLVG